MHTYETNNGFLFHYNSDFSGDVEIAKIVDGITATVYLPGKDLLQFVIRAYIIPRLERRRTEIIDEIFSFEFDKDA